MQQRIGLARRLGVALGMVGLLALAAGPAAAQEVGSAAPAFDFAGAAAGQRIKLEDFKGKVLYVDFWASWCGPCRKSFPWMNEMHKKYGPQGLVVLGVNLDAKSEDAAQFLAATPASFAMAYDPAGVSSRSYKVKAMPTSFLIDANGKVLMVHKGFNDGDRAGMEARFKQALEAAK